MKEFILSRHKEYQFGECIENFYFNTNVWVSIRKSEGNWEYQEGDDEETYQSGGFVVDGNSVIDYDGCFEIPREVEKALRVLGYSIEF